MFWYAPLIKVINIATIIVCAWIIIKTQNRMRISAILICIPAFFNNFIPVLPSYWYFPIPVVLPVLLYINIEREDQKYFKFLLDLYLVPVMILILGTFSIINQFTPPFLITMLVVNVLIGSILLTYKTKYLHLSVYLILLGIFIYYMHVLLSFIYLLNLSLILYLYICLIHKEKMILQAENVQIERLKSIALYVKKVTHDFKNYMSVLSGQIELLLKKNDLDKKMSRDLKRCLTTCNKAINLSEELMLFDQEEELSPGEYQIDTILRNIVESTLENTKIEHEIKYKGEVRSVYVDQGKMFQMFNNIITNSIHSMSGVGKLTIDIKEVLFARKEFVLVSIKDTGCGISKKKLENIFDPYYSTKGTEGSGLGLSIVFDIITKHEGHIKVDSTIDKGTTIYLYLPVAKQVRST